MKLRKTETFQQPWAVFAFTPHYVTWTSFQLFAKGFLTPGQKKIKIKKKEKKKGRHHQNNLEKIRSTKQTEKRGVPCTWQGVASGGSLRFPFQTLPGFCDPTSWGEGFAREGNYGESWRGSVHMAKDQLRLWVPKAPCFLWNSTSCLSVSRFRIMKRNRDSFWVSPEDLKSGKLDLPPFMVSVTALQCTDFQNQLLGGHFNE